MNQEVPVSASAQQRAYLDGMDGFERVDTDALLLELALEDLQLALLSDQLPRLGDVGSLHVGVHQVILHHRRDLRPTHAQSIHDISEQGLINKG